MFSMDLSAVPDDAEEEHDVGGREGARKTTEGEKEEKKKKKTKRLSKKEERTRDRNGRHGGIANSERN